MPLVDRYKARYIQRYLLCCCSTFPVAAPRPIRTFPCTPYSVSYHLSRCSRNEAPLHRRPSYLPAVGAPRPSIVHDARQFRQRAPSLCVSSRSRRTAAVFFTFFTPPSCPLAHFDGLLTSLSSVDSPWRISLSASLLHHPSCISPPPLQGCTPLPTKRAGSFDVSILCRVLTYLVSNRILLHRCPNLIAVTWTDHLDRRSSGPFACPQFAPSRHFAIFPLSRPGLALLDARLCILQKARAPVWVSTAGVICDLHAPTCYRLRPRFPSSLALESGKPSMGLASTGQVTDIPSAKNCR